MKKTQTFDEWVAEAKSIYESAPPFKPHAIYDAETDTLEIFFLDEMYSERRLNRVLSMHLSCEDPKRIVGIEIRKVKAMLGAFAHWVTGEVQRIKVNRLLFQVALNAHKVSTPQAEVTADPEDYDRLSEQVGSEEVCLELVGC